MKGTVIVSSTFRFTLVARNKLAVSVVALGMSISQLESVNYRFAAAAGDLVLGKSNPREDALFIEGRSEIAANVTPSTDDPSDAKEMRDQTATPQLASDFTDDQVVSYLWDVYQRSAAKRDGHGDFTWKDQAAAKRMGISIEDYVIGGMHPDFREQ